MLFQWTVTPKSGIFTILPVLLNPESTGNIAVYSSDSNEEAKIELNYLSMLLSNPPI